MNIPLLLVGGLVNERQQLSFQVTTDIGSRAGGGQVVGGPMLMVPYEREADVRDQQGVTHRVTEHGNYVIFPATGSANTDLKVTDRHRGIYRAATYVATTDFS